MPMDLGVDDKALLAVPSRPRGTRYRNANALPKTSPKFGATLSSTGDTTEIKLDGRGACHGALEDDSENEGEDEDNDDDSVSVYQDSGSAIPSPPPTIPSASAPRSRMASSASPGKNGHAAIIHLGVSGPISDPFGPDALSTAQPVSSQTVSGSADLPTTGGTSKRGRKPAPAASRGAREQARKTNHSRIEKRRREKINEALATLREIVPVGITTMLQAQQSPGLSPALSAVGSTAGKKKGQEKEFKLEVLERTVVFVKYLLERVNELESQVGRTVSSPQLDRNIPAKPDALESESSATEETCASSKKRRRNENTSPVPALPPASTPTCPVPERATKRSRQTDVQHSAPPHADFLSRNNWSNSPQSDASSPLSPTTTLSYSTPYITSVWSPDILTPDMIHGIPLRPSRSEKTSPATRNEATMLTEGSSNTARPKLPSIAAMLNAPHEVSSPSCLPSSGGLRALTSASNPCSPDIYLSGPPPRTSSSSSLTSPMPFRLPSSSLPVHGAIRNSLIDPSDASISSNLNLLDKQYADDDRDEDDEAAAAASLLMHFSYDRDRSSSFTSAKSSSAAVGKGSQHKQQHHYAQAQTPGSILGLRQHHQH